MHMATTLIKNGKVISTTGVIAQDVLITDETITAVGAPGLLRRRRAGATASSTPPASTSSPAAIDVHTHMELPFGGTFASDTFETGSRAAAWGGVTTIVDMAVQRYGENVFDGLAEWHRKADGNCAIDYAFHQIIGGVDDQSLKDDAVPHRARGHHQLQAVHGLPRRVLQRRRPDPEGHADGRRVRGDDHDARRERHRHRRARAAGARPRRDRPEVPQLHPAVAARGRGHAPRHRAQPRRRQRAAVHRAHVGRRRAQRGRRGAPRRPQRVRRDLPAVPVADARGDARQARLRGRQVGVQHAGAQPRTTTPTTSGRWATATRATCGRACG